VPRGNAQRPEESAELRDGLGLGGRLALAGLGLLWLVAAWVCLSSRSPELVLGWFALALGLVLLVSAPFLPRASLRGSLLRSGWGTGSRCNLALISSAQLPATMIRGELVGITLRVSDTQGGRGSVNVRADRPSPLASAVARRILDDVPGLSDSGRTTLRSVVDGLPLRPPYRLRFALLAVVGLVVLTGWIATIVHADWTLARTGTPVASTVTSVTPHTSLRGNQSTSLCTAPAEADDARNVGGATERCLKVAGAARFNVGDAITLRVDPADPARAVVDGTTPSDLGFLAFLVAGCASLSAVVVVLRPRGTTSV
jgi:hypothetical protein